MIMKQDPFATVTNDAVMTVLKCLGLPPYNYHKCELAYRDYRWYRMGWYLEQYNGMLETEVRPFFRNKFNPNYE